jgi:hypothetical protein
MRLIRSIVIACAIATVVAPCASAQSCFSNWTMGQCPISGGSCSTQAWVVQQVLEDGYNYKFGPQSCCGQVVYTPVAQMGTCNWVEEMTPETIRQLRGLADQGEVLVAACDGYLRPLSRLVAMDGPSSPTNALRR